MTLTAFVVFAKDRGRTLPEGIRLLNGYLCDNNQSQMFVTLYAGIVNLRTVNSERHPSLFLGQLRFIATANKKRWFVTSVAIFQDPPYHSTTVQLNSGDTLFLYTDGVNEARNDDGKLFKTGGIESALATNDMTTCELRCDAVMKRLGQFVHGTPQSDDITMVAVSYRGQPEGKCLETVKSAY